MPHTEPFNLYPDEYEAWFEKFHLAYQSELNAIRSLLPPGGTGIEIGIGSGLFALPLGVQYGVEPSPVMAEKARKKGLKVFDGVAERLPVDDALYDYALMVTTVCFVDDVEQSFREVRRILKPGGFFVLAFVDKNSPLGKFYLSIKNEDKFYRDAIFYTTDELLNLLDRTGFSTTDIVQTLFEDPGSMKEIHAAIPGYGKGSFVVIRGKKGSN